MSKRLYTLPLLIACAITVWAVGAMSGMPNAGQAMYAVTQAPADPPAEEEEETSELSEEEIAALEDQMENYMMELGRIANGIYGANTSSLNNLSAMLLGLSTRYDAFMQVQQQAMASNEVLMQLMAQYKVDYQAVSDSLDAQKMRVKARTDFMKCERLLARYTVRYDSLKSQATRFSLIPQTKEQLSKVKATEQVLWQTIEQQYALAKTAVDLNPDLRKRMLPLEQRYIALKEISTQIQAAEYKSFMEKFQDYLKNFAYFAIIMMFFVMLQSKLSAVKAAKASAKKMKDMLDSKNDYPSI